MVFAIALLFNKFNFVSLQLDGELFLQIDHGGLQYSTEETASMINPEMRS